MARFANAVLFNPVAGGTVDFVVSSVVQGYMTPALAGAPDGVYKYRAESADLSQWEIGEGTLTGTTLTRATVLYNSSGTGTATGQTGAGTKINFGSAPQVGIVLADQDILSIEKDNGFTANQKARSRANQDILKRNYIINGAMMVSQEFGTTATTTHASYPVDGYLVSNLNGGTFSAAQVASLTPGGSPNRLRFTVTSADASVAATDLAAIVQRIEGQRAADLRFGSASAKAIVLSFGVKAPAGTYCVAVRNGAVNRSYIGEYTITGGEANTDVVKSVTLVGDTTGTWPTDNTAAIEVIWTLMCGTTYQTPAGVWTAGSFIATSNQFNLMGTNSNVFELFDVGLYEGNAAPAFQVPDYIPELLLCQRYALAFKSTGADTLMGAVGVNWSSTLALMQTQFPVEMRIAPTASFSTASNFAVVGGGTSLTPSALSIDVPTTKNARVRATIAGATAGHGAVLQAANSSATILFNARL